MPGRVRGTSGHRSAPLARGWEFTSCPANAFADPAELAAYAGEWVPTEVPCTAASALRVAGRWSLDDPARRFDADDWWFRTTFDATPAPGAEQWLCFDGLATVADVWLNGALILSSCSMFRAHECRVDERLAARNRLTIRFRALDTLLAEKRPRPRWRAPMVEHQQLRWFRTTLLGRTPGWSPPAAPVGPWRAVRLERRSGVQVELTRMQADSNGRLEAEVRVEPVGGDAIDAIEPIDAVDLVLRRGDRTHRIALTRDAARTTIFAAGAVVPDVVRWWPHTHGEPALYAAALEVRLGGRTVTSELGALGFRSVAVDLSDDGFAIRVNDVPVFCRGACWTPLDVARLDSEDAALDQAFEQLVQSGMNMIRVGGTMAYESDAFLDRCDARGVLLWQDFMFANMDYPADDPAFAAEVTVEADQVLARLRGRPSLAVICGNSEGEQQAAMWGAARERWEPALFSESLAARVRAGCPGTFYWPSSAHGGSFPHQANAGTSSYYGVGAYLRTPDDARRAEVRFATECLAFANVPGEEGIASMPGGHAIRCHSAAWKARTPRDLGAGWDFDDVRDHYVQRRFGVDAVALRYADHARYLELGRVATGELMASTFLEWRRSRSVTRGALVWFLRDLWPGAGWGVIDSDGRPKAAWYHLRRALAPITVGITDEGGNGVAIHVFNDWSATLDGVLELALYRAGDVSTGRRQRTLRVPAHAAIELNAATLFDEFHDLSYAYRFGRPSHDVIAVTLRDVADRVLARAFHWVHGLTSAYEPDVGLEAMVETGASGETTLAVRTKRLARSVQVCVPGFVPDDDFFHLAPGEEHRLLLSPERGVARRGALQGHVRALNAEAVAKVRVP